MSRWVMPESKNKDKQRQKQTEIDLGDLKDIMENFVASLPKMKEQDKVDLAARLKPVFKACEKIDKHVKDELVKPRLKHKDGYKEGSVLGILFKAVLKLVPTTRLDQAGLKENEPEIFDEYNKEVTDARITFELR